MRIRHHGLVPSLRFRKLILLTIAILFQLSEHGYSASIDDDNNDKKTTTTTEADEPLLFSLSIEQAFQHPSLKDKLEPFLRFCDTAITSSNDITDTRSSFQNDDDEEKFRTSCQKARFLNGLVTLETSIKYPTNEPASSSMTGTTAAIIDERSDVDLSFANFFDNFEVSRKPVLISDLPQLIDNVTAREALFSCHRQRGQLLHTNDYVDDDDDDKDETKSKSDDETYDNDNRISSHSKSFSPLDYCNGFSLSSHLKVPKYVMNDYIQRTSHRESSSSPPSHSKADDDDDSFDESLQSIYLQPQQILSPSEATCPSSFHGFYFLLRHFVVENDDTMIHVNVRLFNRYDAVTMLKPHLIVKDDPIPHYIKSYENDAWTVNNDDLSIPSTILSPDSGLFVPSGYLATFQSPSETILFRFCFVDASNWNDAKQSLSLDSFFDPSSKRALETLTHARFDVGMQREVPSLSDWMGGYKSWPRRRQGGEEGDNNQEGGDGTNRRLTNQNNDNNNNKNTQGRKKSRRRQRHTTYSSWQIDRAWDRKVIGMTLPTLSPPDIIDVGRRNVTMAWTCPFRKKDGDASEIGYIVSWTGFSGGDNDDGESRSSEGERRFVVNEEEMGDDFYMEYKRDDRLSSHSSSSSIECPIRRFTGVITGLIPHSYYNFKVRMTYGINNNDADDDDNSSSMISTSPLSPPSSTILTKKPSRPFPLSSPPVVITTLSDTTLTDQQQRQQALFHDESISLTTIYLSMQSPYDDGGLTILTYDVMKAHVVDDTTHTSSSSQQHAGKWVFVKPHNIDILTTTSNNNKNTQPGGIVTMAIHNVLPGAKYIFKVAARNELGRGDWSSSSEASAAGGGVMEDGSLVHDGRRLSSLDDKKEPLSQHHAKMKKKRILRGWGHHHRRLLHKNKKNNSAHTMTTKRGPVIILNDIDQQITTPAMMSSTSAKFIDAWSCHWSPHGFLVGAESYYLQDDTSKEELWIENVDDRIVVIDRSYYGRQQQHDSVVVPPLSVRVMSMQRSGAIGVVISDDEGRCDGGYDQYCMLGGNKLENDRWGEFDAPGAWEGLRIPVVLVREGDGVWRDLKRLIIEGSRGGLDDDIL